LYDTLNERGEGLIERLKVKQTARSRLSALFLKISDPMVLIFLILCVTYLMSLVVPAGQFRRELVSLNGLEVEKVIPGSFSYLAEHPMIHPFDIFVAIPKGLLEAAPYLFIVFLAGALFHVLQSTGALENLIGVTVHRIGAHRRKLIITAGTFIYGFFGVAVGFENNIALIPVAGLIASAIGASPLVGICMAVGGIGVGFALSPINPYTVGVAQKIAGLPAFSGAGFRAMMVLSALSLLALYIIYRVDRPSEPASATEGGLTQRLEEYSLSQQQRMILLIFAAGLGVMVYGALTRGWFINEIGGLFIFMTILIGFAYRLSATELVAQMMVGASEVTSGALVIGLAASIKVILDQAMMTDTLVMVLSGLIEGLPLTFAAIASSVVQGVINLFVPSGSGQAMITMPILAPLADLIGMERQLMITSFQVGDGLTNLIVPTSGGTLAMLALGRVSYAEWLRVITPFMVVIYLLCWGFLALGQAIGYA